MLSDQLETGSAVLWSFDLSTIVKVMSLDPTLRWGNLHCMGRKLLSNCFGLPVVSHSYLFVAAFVVSFAWFLRGRRLDCGVPLVAEFQRGLERLATRSYEVSLGGSVGIMRSTKEGLFPGGLVWFGTSWGVKTLHFRSPWWMLYSCDVLFNICIFICIYMYLYCIVLPRFRHLRNSSFSSFLTWCLSGPAYSSNYSLLCGLLMTGPWLTT